MAAPKKQGIQYFPYDVDLDQDDKLQMIIGDFGLKGETIYVKLLGWIYKHKGYYAEWNEETQLKFANRVAYAIPNKNGETGSSRVNLINEVVKRCIKWGLFDKAVFESFQVLTSKRIQETWWEATRKRKDRIYDPEIWITDINGGSKAEETPKKAEETLQSKVKESKVKGECKEPPPPSSTFASLRSHPMPNSQPPGAAPTLLQVQEVYMQMGGTPQQAERFFLHHEGIGWKKGITPIQNWRAIANMWIADDSSRAKNNSKPKDDDAYLRERQKTLDKQKQRGQ